MVAAIDRLIDSQVSDPASSLDGAHHTAITLPALLRKRAFLTGKVKALQVAPEPMRPRLVTFQTEELIALALATCEIPVAAAHCAALPATARHNLVAYWGRDHSDVPTVQLMRMLLALPKPEMRALAIANYFEGLAQRGLILDPLLA